MNYIERRVNAYMEVFSQVLILNARARRLVEDS